jgi:group I intron endonuclease
MTTDKNTWILYQTTNTINGKIYIGVHKVADTWKSRNYLGSGKALKPAIEKYGRENFRRATLAEFSCAEEAYVAEAGIVTEEFIKRSDTYNVKVGGEGGVGLKHTEETRAKMSASKKGTTATDETKAKMSAALKGRIFTEDTRAKLSVAAKGHKRCVGRVVREDTRAKIGAANKGKTHSEEVKTKISKSLLGNQYRLGIPHSEESKTKMSVVAKGRKLSEEHKINISISKMGNQHCLGRKLSEEHKAKIAATLKRKAVVINGTYYESETFAATIEQVHRTTLRSRLKNLKPEWSEWRYATEEERENYLARDAQST